MSAMTAKNAKNAKTSRRRFVISFAALAALAATPLVGAQSTKPLRIIVPLSGWWRHGCDRASRGRETARVTIRRVSSSTTGSEPRAASASRR